jgi:hypothetical protein
MKPLPWSPSAISSVHNCPRQHHEVKVLKRVKEEPKDANEWGIRVHKNLEDACAQRAKLPEDVKYLQPFVDMVAEWRRGIERSKTGFLGLEYKMAINKNLEPVNFFAADVWGRLVSDAIYVMPSGDKAIILDWKTGKRKPSSQMLYNALLAFCHFPSVNFIRTNFVWLKENTQDPAVFARADLPALWQKAMEELKVYRDVFVNETWIPRESGLCNGWCPVKTCEYWKPGKKK